VSTEELDAFVAQDEYLDESSLLNIKEFSTTMKHGYIIDQVDLWVGEAFTHVQNLVNEYNNLAYRAGQKVEELQNIIDRLESENSSLQEQLQNAQNNKEVVYVTPEPEPEIEPEPVPAEPVPVEQGESIWCIYCYQIFRH